MSDDPRPVKLLLDENLSTKVGEQLRAEGIDAVNIRERGILGAPDHEVLRRAYEEDRVLVTSNVADFAKLYGTTELNAGLVVIKSGELIRAEQLALLRTVVGVLSGEPDMINRVLEVEADGSFKLGNLP